MSTLSNNNSYETFILKQIKRLEFEFKKLQEEVSDYSERDLKNKFHRISGQIDILYICLTGHDNKYHENKKRIK